MDPRRAYASSFLEESLGLAKGSVEPDAVPTDFVSSLSEAMGGSEKAGSQTPALEKRVAEIGSDIVQSTLESDGFVLRKERWPHAAKYGACLTHDVDSISRPASHIFLRRARFSVTTLLLALLGLRNPYDNIDYAVDLERRRGLRSSFYFLSEGYDLTPKASRLGSIRDQGWEVGLHGDFGTHDSLDKMSQAIERVRKTTGALPSGVREHYLRFDFQKTWGVMDAAGLAYDSTVGYADRLGFRVGLCNPFHPPDGDWKPLRLLELPLTLMDATLWGYLKRSEPEGMEDFQRVSQDIEQVNGLLTLLWHQESLRMKGGRIYPAVLDSLLKDGCFMATGASVADWWLRRSAPLVKEGKTFSMEDAPAGLVLKLGTRGGATARVEGGNSTPERDGAAITATGGPVRVILE